MPFTSFGDQFWCMPSLWSQSFRRSFSSWIMLNWFSLVQLDWGNVDSLTFSVCQFSLRYLFFILTCWLSTIVEFLSCAQHLHLMMSMLHGKRKRRNDVRKPFDSWCLIAGNPLLGHLIWLSISIFQLGRLLGELSWCWPVFRRFCSTYCTFNLLGCHSVHLRIHLRAILAFHPLVQGKFVFLNPLVLMLLRGILHLHPLLEELVHLWDLNAVLADWGGSVWASSNLFSVPLVPKDSLPCSYSNAREYASFNP